MRINVLAQFGRKIELVQMDESHRPAVGQTFDRMPVNAMEAWTIIKVFNHVESLLLDSLIKLMELDIVQKLFELELPEAGNYRQTFEDTVHRMSREA